MPEKGSEFAALSPLYILSVEVLLSKALNPQLFLLKSYDYGSTGQVLSGIILSVTVSVKQSIHAQQPSTE